MSGAASKDSAAGEKLLRLLLADDDPNHLELCLHDLRKSKLNFQAEAVSTREEFARKLRDADVDVIVSGYRMKDWTGLDALAIAKEVRPDVPFVLLSGTLGDEMAGDCLKLDATDYIVKGNLARLPEAIRRALEERSRREGERKALVALRENAARYRGLVDHAIYGIYWITLEGELLDVNPALVRMLGYHSEAELRALKYSAVFYRDAGVRDAVHSEYLKSGRIDTTVEWRRKDGKIITVRLNGRRVKDPQSGEECVEVIAEDVTDRKNLERQLLQAQKFEAIGQLAGGIAHDFNNMIGAILGWADLGAEETDPSLRTHRYFEKIRRQSDRATALTRQLLAFARRQVLEPRSIDLSQTVVETLSLLEKIIGSNIEVRATLAPDLAIIRADPVQIEQVLMNLCINARDAMPNGGSLDVETANVELDEQFCNVQPLAHPGRYVVLTVTDTGTGMDAATLDRVFEPFFTTKELGKGTGLGLATIYGIVRQHGGFIQAYSEPDHGSTFRAYFPMCAEVPQPPGQRDEVRMVPGGSETVLLAEGHEGLRQLAVGALAKLGYTVLAAADGEEALRRLRTGSQRISLAVLDVMLPKLGGLEVYARIRAENPDLPVILTTGYRPDSDSVEQTRQLELPVIQKPYSSRELAHRVRHALDHRSRLVAGES